MKKLIFIFTLVVFITGNSFSQIPNEWGPYDVDSIHAVITTAQGHDTIAAHPGDPWFVILDVRTPGEYNPQHLFDAVNVDRGSPSLNAILDTLNKDKIYVVYCLSGARATYVCGVMRTKHFRFVYNMGAITAWNSAGYPTTTTVAPELGILSDTIVTFDSIVQGNTDSIKIIITNMANSVLIFDSISDLTVTDFSAGFNLTKTLYGARDYSFYVYYQPADTIPDSVAFTLHSNGGALTIHLNGSVIIPTKINNPVCNDISIRYDMTGKKIYVFSPEIFQGAVLNIFDAVGKICYANSLSGNSGLVDVSFLPKGFYIFSMMSGRNKKSMKFPVY
ncbi:MAG: rhodanese-like domain-containing protein [Bacteroidia bacterium]|nr:rhodanese-like domain-containing protein [Bacteroidia bacterium]